MRKPAEQDKNTGQKLLTYEAFKMHQSESFPETDLHIDLYKDFENEINKLNKDIPLWYNFFMFKKGFTLIELLVVISIIGILSTVVITSLSSARHKAQGTHVVGSIRAIHLAFNARAIDDNINAWWHEDDFPGTTSWAAYIEDLVILEDFINEFLPIAPDIPGAGETVFKFAYDSDYDIYSDPSTEFACNNWTHTGSWGSWVSLRGVNIVIDPGAHPDGDRYWDMFHILDKAFDKGDGPYCGSMRADGKIDRTNGNRARHKYFRYMISPDHREIGV